jgi:hypothetical protein
LAELQERYVYFRLDWSSRIRHMEYGLQSRHEQRSDIIFVGEMGTTNERPELVLLRLRDL